MNLFQNLSEMNGKIGWVPLGGNEHFMRKTNEAPNSYYPVS